MKREGERAWDRWTPHLFLYFDPAETYLRKLEPQFRDSEGKLLLDVDDSLELLLLGYAALSGIWEDRLPTIEAWQRFCAQIEAIAKRSSQVFDWQAYARRCDGRLGPARPFTYSHGSMEIMFLHDELLRAEDGLGELGSHVWCSLCLLWIDRAVHYQRSGEIALAIESSLRAADALACSKPRKTRLQALQDMSSLGGKSRAAKHPTARMKEGAYAFWLANRDDIPVKAELARQIQDKYPDLLNLNVILRWIRTWEREAPAVAPPRKRPHPAG